MVEGYDPHSGESQGKERELQEKDKEIEREFISPIIEPSEYSIIQALAQVNLKEMELSGLKN